MKRVSSSHFVKEIDSVHVVFITHKVFTQNNKHMANNMFTAQLNMPTANMSVDLSQMI